MSEGRSNTLKSREKSGENEKETTTMNGLKDKGEDTMVDQSLGASDANEGTGETKSNTR